MAEEMGQAATQPALEALNPHQAVEALSAMIEQEESPAQVRDEKGKFTKPATEEAQPEKEATEVQAEETKPEEEQPEITPEPRRFKLKYKGEELEKDESEVVSLAQQGFDYTQKSQALAKEKLDLEAKVKTDTEAAIKQYETQLEVHKQAVLKLADPDALNADLNKLSLEDPARAQQLFFKRLQIQQTLQGIHAEQQRMAQARDTEAQATKVKKISESLETIQREIPSWNQEVYGKILKTAVESGATQQEANAITDPWQIKVLNKARQWDEYVAAKPKTVDKRVAAVPKVQKPGTSEKTSPNADKYKESVARLNKTGDRNAAVDVVRQMIESGQL